MGFSDYKPTILGDPPGMEAKNWTPTRRDPRHVPRLVGSQGTWKILETELNVNLGGVLKEGYPNSWMVTIMVHTGKDPFEWIKTHG